MVFQYINRSLDPVLRRVALEFPSVLLTGPRQSGKTTLLQHVFGDTVQYVSLELPSTRMFAIKDPQGFLDAHPPPVIIDEIQNAPDLLQYIKDRIDKNRAAKGQFILSGSQNILLSNRVSESLAGRVGVLTLLPMSRREIDGCPMLPLKWERQFHSDVGPTTQGNHLALWRDFLRGGYPELVNEPSRSYSSWYGSYVQTYLERDVRTLRQIGDLTLFQNFLQTLAARSAQLLNLTDIARDLAVSVNSIKAWLSVLEASYLVTVIRPYYGNVGKRLVKTPKVYFSDVGLLCYLTGLRDPEHAMAGPMGGAIFETAVLSEIVRTITHREERPQIYFWRTTTGAEVDFIVNSKSGLVPIEVKLSATPRHSMADNISKFQKILPDHATSGFVVHTGKEKGPLAASVGALPYSHI